MLGSAFEYVITSGTRCFVFWCYIVINSPFLSFPLYVADFPVITYTKALTNIDDILRKNMKILNQSDKMKNVFNQQPIVSFRRDKDIKDILVHRKHNLQFYNKHNGCKRFGKNCALCKYLLESTTFEDNGGHMFMILVFVCVYAEKIGFNVSSVN
jgi:hypothetical protein